MSAALKPRTTSAFRAWLPLFLLGAFLPVGNGNATPPAPFLTLTGEAARDAFGWAVACPGDVNGDGYSDLLVGAPGTDKPGKAYVYFGGPGADSLPGAVLEEEESYARLMFGSS